MASALLDHTPWDNDHNSHPVPIPQSWEDTVIPAVRQVEMKITAKMDER